MMIVLMVMYVSMALDQIAEKEEWNTVMMAPGLLSVICMDILLIFFVINLASPSLLVSLIVSLLLSH